MRSILRALVLAALVALPAERAAAVFIPIEGGRTARATYHVGGVPFPEEAVSETPGVFDESVTTLADWGASQSSTFDPTFMGGTGSAFTGQGGDGASDSMFVWAFALTEPTPISFTGTLTNESTSGWLLVTLFRGRLPIGGPNILYLADASLEHTVVPLSYEAVLPAGEYLLYVEASFNGSVTGDPPGERATWDFALQAVPEPGTAALLGLGLASLAALRRRR